MRDEPISETGTQKARRWGQLPSAVPEWTVAPVTQATALSPRGSQAPCPSTAAAGTHVWVSIPEEFVEHVAELPAEHCVAGQGQPVDNRPKGLRSLLVVGAQYAR